MPLLYGEEEKAFTRLQKEIIIATPDLSIFAWASKRKVTAHTTLGSGASCGILAESPQDFLV
ncbi:ankyrin repeat-containing protein [Colletotrichum incanum]|uniref:Ankyrin repeat-containing protein n=1 Tax=Colletotrichum incanum TaxID=1573173 RepID=A0A167B1T7_COLIC|nr:ankyrin repeat-containing protein [Colletotrichum incanum]